ncbi:MAG: FliH/SctL family protein [Phycisphaerales bacterium]
MAIIRATQAAPLMRDAVVLDLGDLHHQAEQLKARARAEADRILAEARREAKTLTEAASTRGFEEGLQKGLAEGRASGIEQGRAEAMKANETEIARCLEQWSHAADEFDAERRDLMVDARTNLVRLALQIAERVVRQVIAVDPERVNTQVEQAITLISEETRLVIAIHPDDLPVVERTVPELAQRLTGAEEIRLEPDETVERGGCVVRGRTSEIDARLQTQLDRIADALVPRSPARPAEDPNDAESA